VYPRNDCRFQFVEYFIDKGVLGESKGLSCTVLEHKCAPLVVSSPALRPQRSLLFRSPPIAQYSQGKYDSTLEQPIKLPVVPATLIGVCRLIQIYYVFKVCHCVQLRHVTARGSIGARESSEPVRFGVQSIGDDSS
jgi:hypothetical protein